MSTALLSAAGHPATRGPVRTGAAGALDVVHDHVLRLLGDAEAAARVMADVALRATARAATTDAATDLQPLLRSAHARLQPVERVRPGSALVARLAGGPAGRALVLAMADADRHGAAVLDLTARHGLHVREAAAVIGIDHATAARARTAALDAIRADLAHAGASVDVDVPAALAGLPVVPAPDAILELLDLPAAATPRGPVHPVLAWLTTALVALATVAGLVVGLPALAEADASNAPVVRAQAVEEGPAAERLATPGDDRPEGEVEQLVVRNTETQADGGATVTEGSATAGTAGDTAAEPGPAPTPTDSASSEPASDPSDGTADQPADEPTQEPSEEPSEGPLGQLLPDGP